jgi:hypothetical protein
MDVWMYVCLYVCMYSMYVCMEVCRCVDVVAICMEYSKLNNIGVCKST